MRSIKLTAAVAAAATVLAVAPAVAPAAPKHPHPQLSGEETAHASRCGLNIYAEPRSITVGETVEVFGQLNCGIRASATGRTITLYDHTPGGGNKAVATTTTVAAGFYSFVAPALTTNSTFFVRGAGVRSADRPVKVGPVVTLSGPTDGSQLFTGVRHEVTFTGTVSPADIGARVVLQRENATSSEEWHAIQFGYVLPAPGGPAAGGVYSLTHRFVSPGDANIRVIVRGLPPLIGRGTSNTLSYQISQAQNPKLTINSSNDAVSYGAPVTISGILAGGADKTVTLLARPRLVTGFTSIASAPTNEAGEYKFVIASAARNTFYQTTGEGISSAVLFQGVKYVLTAGVSATKATAGTAVTFSGTVTPGHEGHVVYLERQNKSGSGFHVVNVGTVSGTGTYSIEEHLFGSGSQLYRVRVPGDPENQAVSSSPFTIEVTPAPAPSLRPVTPAVLPKEGEI